MKRHLSYIAALGMCLAWSPITYAQVFGTRIEATSCASAVGGNITASNVSVVCGIPPEVLDALVRSRTVVLEELVTAHRETITLLKGSLDLNERQIRAALEAIGENNIPPERLAAKLVEIAERFRDLQASASTLPGDSPSVIALKADAQKAIEEGELAKASELLTDVVAEQTRSLDRLTVNAADTYDRLGDIALTRLRYAEAAKHFANAAAVFPPGSAHEVKKIEYLASEASALYQQGHEFGDNGALFSAIERRRRLIELMLRERVPSRWAMTQNNLGNALSILGERESGTAKLEEAVAAYREALQELTRERVPLDWAMTQNNLGNALQNLGMRESGTAKLEEAVAAYREALKERTRERVPLDWAMTQNNLSNALFRLGERESGTAKLEEAVAACREALKEGTRERVPLDWAMTQNNLGNALGNLGERESGTAKLEEAVATYREALQVRTRELVPLDWAISFGQQGIALMLLAGRRGDAAMAETALSQIKGAFETMRDGGNAFGAGYFEQRLPVARAIVTRLRESEANQSQAERRGKRRR
jgi:tetratricopeptide (TPR) repeat protein